VVIKRDLYEKHPWLALNLFHCFMAAKKEVEHEAADTLKDYFDTGLMDAAGANAMKLDPKSYGMKSSRTVVETIARYVHEQGLTDRVVQVEEMFAPSTLEV
jgi:4,5-dihydroxyphthalate decarboxylase